MSEHVYNKSEVTGSSTESIDHAIRSATQAVGKSLEGLRWFEVTEIRGDIEDNDVAHWQVSLKVGFRVDPQPDERE